METPTIIALNRPKSPNYLPPRSPDSHPSQIRPWRNPLIPRYTSSLSDRCRPVFFSLYSHQSCVSLCSPCPSRRSAAGGWLFPSSLYTCRTSSTTVEYALQIAPLCAKQTQSPKPKNHHNLLCDSDLPQYPAPIHSKKQTQSNPISQRDTQYKMRNTTPVPMPFPGEPRRNQTTPKRNWKRKEVRRARERS